MMVRRLTAAAAVDTHSGRVRGLAVCGSNVWSGDADGMVHIHTLAPPHACVGNVDVRTGVAAFQDSPSSGSPHQGGGLGVRCMVPVGRTRTVWVGTTTGVIVVVDQEEGPEHARGISVAEGHTAAVNELLAKGKYVFSAASDFSVGVWDAPSLTPRQFLRGHANWVRSLALTGLHLWSAGDDGTILVWSASGQQVDALDAGEPIHALAYTKYNTVWAGSSSGSISVYDVTSATQIAKLPRLPGWITGLQATDLHVWATCSDGSLALFHAQTRARISLASPGAGSLLAVHPLPPSPDSEDDVSAWVGAADASLCLWVWAELARAPPPSSSTSSSSLATREVHGMDEGNNGDDVQLATEAAGRQAVKYRKRIAQLETALTAAQDMLDRHGAHARSQEHSFVIKKGVTEHAHALALQRLETELELVTAERDDLAEQLLSSRSNARDENTSPTHRVNAQANTTTSSATDPSSLGDEQSVGSLLATVTSLRSQLHNERKSRAAKERSMVTEASAASLQITQLKNQLEEARAVADAAAHAAKAGQKSVANLKLQLATQIERADKAESKAEVLGKRLRGTEAQVKTLSTRGASASRTVSDAEHAQVRERALKSEADVLELSKDVESLREAKETLLEQVNALRTRTRTAEQARRAELRRSSVLEHKVDAAEKAKEKALQQVQNHRTVIQKISAATHEAETEIRSLEAQHHAAVATLQHQLEGAHNELDIAESELHTLRLDTSAQISTLEAALDSVRAELATEKKLHASAKRERDGLRKAQLVSLDVAGAEARVTAAGAEAVSARARAEEAEQEAEHLRRALESAEEEADGAKEAEISMRREVERVRTALANVQREREQALAKVQAAESDAAVARAEADGLREELAEEAQLVDMASSHSSELKSLLLDTKAQVSTLRKSNLALAEEVRVVSARESESIHRVHQLESELRTAKASLEKTRRTTEADLAHATRSAQQAGDAAALSVAEAEAALAEEVARGDALRSELALLRGRLEGVQGVHSSEFEALENQIEAGRVARVGMERERDAALAQAARLASQMAEMEQERDEALHDAADAARQAGVLAGERDALLKSEAELQHMIRGLQKGKEEAEARARSSLLAAEDAEESLNRVKRELAAEQASAAEAQAELAAVAAASVSNNRKVAVALSEKREEADEVQIAQAEIDLRASMAEREAALASAKRDELKRKLAAIVAEREEEAERLKAKLDTVYESKGLLEEQNFILKQKLAESASKRDLYRSQRDAARSHLQQVTPVRKALWSDGEDGSGSGSDGEEEKEKEKERMERELEDVREANAKLRAQLSVVSAAVYNTPVKFESESGGETEYASDGEVTDGSVSTEEL